MYQRFIKPSSSNSFFLFGPRGTGKSTWLKQHFKVQSKLWFDLLIPEVEDDLRQSPSKIIEYWKAITPKPEWIVIDEVQKLPALLDVVHYAISNHNIKFALTGSSAKKLKKGASNLLAGRAFVFYMHPLTYLELDQDFSLNTQLQWGSLPKIMELQDPTERKRFLRAYTLTYLKEEIQTEQLVRQIDAFHRFLPVAAQCSGEILNYAHIAREARVDPKSVERYFDILADTLIGFRLDAFHNSIRKRQTLKPKFYLFDLGVTRALRGTAETPVITKTSEFGHLFEQFIILECFRLNNYTEQEFKFSYLRTKDNVEIDLIIERPSKQTILIEIKSTDNITNHDLTSLKTIGKDFNFSEKLILCREQRARIIDDIKVLPWQEGLKLIFNL
jgi:uncharacterized protein